MKTKEIEVRRFRDLLVLQAVGVSDTYITPEHAIEVAARLNLLAFDTKADKAAQLESQIEAQS